MFTNLIESQSHGREFKRRGRFVLATAAGYFVLFFAAGIASIYAYDARLESQTTDLVVDLWVPPVKPIPATVPRTTQPTRRSAPSNAPTDPNVRVAERTVAVSTTTDPRVMPTTIGTMATDVPPVTGPVRITGRNVDPPTFGDSIGCVTCTDNGTSPIRVEETTPPPLPTVPVRPPTQRLPSSVLVSKVISLPQPPYPPLAKQIRIQGAVNVQILVDEQGRVVSAQPVSGHPTLLAAAKEAAMRARFTPTLLSGQPVKVQGVITYNFVLQ